ncbi:MAG: DedA family protein [Proteobacteria bacterium]|nr:DedA family protein [Pseudomonadota bacterium]
MLPEIEPQKIIAFVEAHRAYAPLVIFLLALGETIVVVSVFIPSTFLLFAIGGLMAAAGVPLIPSLIAGGLGASLGFSLMYILSAALEGRLLTYWPFRNFQDTIAKAAAFSRRWGIWGVAIGHFGGPIRVLIPIVSGISRMPPAPFMLANFVGAFGWICVFFAPGHLLVSSTWFQQAYAGVKAMF